MSLLPGVKRLLRVRENARNSPNGLADRDPKMAEADAAIIAQLKQRFKLVGGPAVLGESR